MENMANTPSELLVETLVETEWAMFQNVHNEGGRAGCQDDFPTFQAMRTAQFAAWSEETARSYLEDLEEAQAQGRNLLAEKYFHMMKVTAPEEYAAGLDKVRLPDEEQLALIDQIMALQLPQTQALREKYPLVGEAGRPLYAAEDRPWDMSVETYQRGEYATYSARTLSLLYAHIKELSEQGVSFAQRVLENSVCSYGYESLAQAEATLTYHQE
jgi:hypothetical protein